MLQLIVFIYGIVVLFRGAFPLGGGKVVIGTRARILGLLCVCILPLAFVIGLTIGIMAAMGAFEMPDQFIMLGLDVGLLIVSLILIMVLGHSFYRRQQVEEAMIDPASTPDRNQFYTVTDPNNPYASPSIKS